MSEPLTTKNPSRIIGPESVRMLELGHPWIIADTWTKRWPSGKPGDIISLTDEQGRFCATALIDPTDRIVARVLSRRQTRVDQRWVRQRLTEAIELRTNHLCSENSTAYRLVNGEGDGLPGFTVDRYGDYLMLQLYTPAWRPFLPLLTGELQKILKPAGIYEKTRPRSTRDLEATGDSKKCGRLLVGTPAPDRLPVMENGLTFLVTLEQGLNTGLFLDQRDNRRDLMGRTAGKRLLNLFSYTGAFSVAAAASGAAQVTSVDASAGYTDWAKENFRANRLNPDAYEFLCGDCFPLLADLARQRRRYDIILMDPPSFSTTAKSRFTTRGGTSDIVSAALPLLSAGGLLIASSNHQKTDSADYLKELRRGALKAGTDLRVISLKGQPEDFPYPVTFPEGRYLKYAICVKGGETG